MSFGYKNIINIAAIKRLWKKISTIKVRKKKKKKRKRKIFVVNLNPKKKRSLYFITPFPKIFLYQKNKWKWGKNFDST